MITCLKCGGQNRREAKFCSSCGADLSPTRAMPSAGPSRGRPAVSVLTRPLPVEEETAVILRPTGQLTPLRRGSILSHPGDPRRRYGIVMARKLEHSTYYDALDLTCPACQSQHENLPPDGLCQSCQTSLATVLIHERYSPPRSFHSDAQVRQLIHLSAGQANIIPHRDIVQHGERAYAATEYPDRWGVLVRGRRQRSPDEALAGVVQVGQALAYLHDHDFAYSEVGIVGIESLVATGGGTEIRLADLSFCVPLPPDDVEARQTQVNRDIVFLSNLLFYLATGQLLQHGDINLAPPALRPFIERALQGQYASVSAMLADFSLQPSAPTLSRSLKPSHGQATHPGRQRARNEDTVVTFTFDKEQEGRSAPVGFYLIADGMGGHDAGDVASQSVNQIVTARIIDAQVLPDLRKAARERTTEDVPGELLTRAIQQANEALLRLGQTENSDLGSTVTAALIIGDVATIASVGDSRTYLLRAGRLEQITQDHSLVARLVDAGVIGPEEVRSHPQRSHIYRCLGHEPVVEVDTFTRQLRAGDVLLLCSDGLWEMVPDAEIRRLVKDARSPQRACDALLEAANRAGGEDNIAVIVVKME